MSKRHSNEELTKAVNEGRISHRRALALGWVPAPATPVESTATVRHHVIPGVTAPTAN